MQTPVPSFASRTRWIPASRAGFTLLELMIVCVLIAIVGSIAIPRVSISQWKVDGAMRVVQGVLQQAERNAIQRQMEVGVSFDATKNRIRVHFDQNGNHTIDAGEETRWYPLEEGNRFGTPPVGVSGTVGSFVNGAKVSTSSEGYPTVFYHRDGAASTAFEVYLRSPKTNLNDFRAVVVTQSTGRVTMYRYGATSWFKASM